jgi:aryl-alcohol dehydrogenase-like predicted oxidoreductase
MTEANSRRDFLQTAAGLTVALAAEPGATAAPLPDSFNGDLEWRNKQPGMHYRRLGRTGLMISEVVSGGDPISSNNYEHLNLALEMGLNYLDMAPAYGNGDCEIAYGKFLAGSAKRDKVFLQTKVSAYGGVRNRLYQQLFETLPGGKQSAVMARVDEIKRTNLAEKPGYYLTYFPGQHNQFAGSYLSSAMRADYGSQVENRPELRQCIIDSLEGSLKRVGTDHFDLLMCPHGVNTADEMDNPIIHETFTELKKQGKVRFLGLTSHNDPAAALRKAVDLGHYDAMQMAYNVINAGYVDQAILEASARNIGMIAMKTAHAVATHHKSLQPVPQWRIDKVNREFSARMRD